MSQDPIKLSIDPSVLISLKAEILKKQEEFRSKKLNKTQNLDEKEYEIHKTQTVWGKKTKKDEKNDEHIKPKDVDDSDHPQTSNEENVFEKSRKMLETKAQYYENVVNRRIESEEGDEEIFLVDFARKVNEPEIDDETNSLKLKNKITESDYFEQLRIKWENEKLENIEKEEIHYQDIKYDEIRNLGVGNFKFSKDEVERNKQMEFFKKIEKEVKSNRISNEIYRLKREKLLIERLNKIKQRRFLKSGYTNEEIEKLCKFDDDLLEIENEIEHLNKVGNEMKEEIEQKPLEINRKIILDRDWDKPKLKEKIWEKHIAKLRNERNKTFAPPKSYESVLKNKKNKKS